MVGFLGRICSGQTELIADARCDAGSFYFLGHVHTAITDSAIKTIALSVRLSGWPCEYLTTTSLICNAVADSGMHTLVSVQDMVWSGGAITMTAMLMTD